MSVRKLVLALLLACSSQAQAQAPIANYDVPMLLGGLKAANFNTTSDQPITLAAGSATKYIITQVTVTNASTALSLALGGFYTGASKTGTILIAATQAYATLTSATKFVNCTIPAILTTDVRSESQIFLSLSTGQGSAATADVYFWGYPLQ